MMDERKAKIYSTINKEIFISLISIKLVSSSHFKYLLQLHNKTYARPARFQQMLMHAVITGQEIVEN